MLLKLLGLLIVLAAAYGVYRWLWGRGFFADGAACVIWFFLASLYKPGPRG